MDISKASEGIIANPLRAESAVNHKICYSYLYHISQQQNVLEFTLNKDKNVPVSMFSMVAWDLPNSSGIFKLAFPIGIVKY